METVVLFFVLLMVTVCLLLLFRKAAADAGLLNRITDLQTQLADIKSVLRDELRINRGEYASLAGQSRAEINVTIKDLQAALNSNLVHIMEQNAKAFETINQTLEQRVTAMSNRMSADSQLSRTTLAENLQSFSTANTRQLELVNNQMNESLNRFRENFADNIRSLNDLQRDKFRQMDENQKQLVQVTENKLDSIRHTVEEKLEKTLSERLGQSFDTVGRQLIEVQKGLGEMQTLAQDVGGLKRVLSNVKMRGGFGEVQLHMLLESILAPGQYEANIATKQHSTERVEFAVKFPNKEGDRDFVWLPIDAKFPKDAYENLQQAYDAADPLQIETAQKGLEMVIRKMARDISDKYLDVPHTTNFGIMFLPFEGLFAEVVRKASLLEQIQRECNVIITGPTTLAVILNSLQMGFRTLAIQKRSSEVWTILGAVKKEFSEFGGLLGKAQKNIQTGLNQLDDVVGKRTRAIERKLKGVETMEQGEMKLEPNQLKEDFLVED